jgi:Tol biopolymer transport system component
LILREESMTIIRICAAVLAMGALACSGPVEVDDGDEVGGLTAMSGPYLGETPPTTEAVVFAPGKVSIAGRYEYAMSIHPAGDRLIFTVEVPDKGASVHGSSIHDGSWTKPGPVDLTGGAKRNEMEAFFSPDGKRVFFAVYCQGMDVRIWAAEVTPKGFCDPHPLGEPVAQDPSFYPVQANDGSLYYTNLAERAVFRAILENGEVTSAESAGLERGGHAFPSPDGSFMVLDSASLDSKEQRDIFVAFRTDDGSWGSPWPLGPAVNTEHSETCPALSPDGKYLFFSRYNEPGGISNIYWVSSEVIKLAAPV